MILHVRFDVIRVICKYISILDRSLASIWFLFLTKPCPGAGSRFAKNVGHSLES